MEELTDRRSLLNRRSTLRGIALGAAVAVLPSFLHEGTAAAESEKAPPKSAQAKPKPWKYAWGLEDEQVRGIIINYRHALQGGEIRDPWRGFCEKHGLAWCQGNETTFDSQAAPPPNLAARSWPSGTEPHHVDKKRD